MSRGQAVVAATIATLGLLFISADKKSSNQFERSPSYVPGILTARKIRKSSVSTARNNNGSSRHPCLTPIMLQMTIKVSNKKFTIPSSPRATFSCKVLLRNKTGPWSMTRKVTKQGYSRPRGNWIPSQQPSPFYCERTPAQAPSPISAVQCGTDRGGLCGNRSQTTQVTVNINNQILLQESLSAWHVHI